MAESSTFLAWAESLATMSYYEILRVDPRAPAAEIQRAFHAMSLRCHPDRFVEEGPDVAAAAAAVFKRAVEAYNVLRRPALRGRYDAELLEGRLELDERAIPEKKRYEQRTLYMIARTPKAKQHAARADQALSNGNLEDARVQLITAKQHDPGNEELEERLQILYEALMLEPGDIL